MLLAEEAEAEIWPLQVPQKAADFEHEAFQSCDPCEQQSDAIPHPQQKQN